jgi:CHAD domain-containing protein
MHMALASRWMVMDSQRTPVASVASRTLRKRLETVWSELEAACERAARDDAERVHQLRVATRRALAALDAFRDLLPDRQRSWFEKQLRRIRRAAGNARDLDVLTDRLAVAPADEFPKNAAPDRSRGRQRLVAMLSKQRDVSRQPILERHEKLIEGDWPGRMERLLESIPTGRRQPSFGTYARRRFKPMIDHFFAAADRKLRDPAEIHRLRIEGKKIRYSMEIFAAVFPPQVRARCHDSLEQLQKTLGDFTDHSAAADRFKRWAEGGTVAPSNRELLASLRREETELADKARKAFAKWWSPSRRRSLRRRFERTLRRNSA